MEIQRDISDLKSEPSTSSYTVWQEWPKPPILGYPDQTFGISYIYFEFHIFYESMMIILNKN